MTSESSDTLRKRPHIGATTAHSLATQLRTDTHARLGSPHHEPEPHMIIKSG
ncbi:hypothetical protein [Frankia gtarii]|uniref:hypothetical protein n=1 Tax=Frankia gtarii TaxID=2950102 RepID=UPI0021BFF4A1|nr:hypothetical protein [Frankia gtarii]